MKIARQVGEALYGFGIRRIYGLPGEDHMALLDAFAAAGLSYCTAFDESSAVIMAATDAQVTGLPGVAILSLAPGVSNGINGLLNTFLEEVPLLLISGQHPAGQLPFVVRQGFNIEKLLAPITKWQGKVTADMHVPNVLGRAIDEAMSGRPGPVYLELPDAVATSESKAADEATRRAVARLRSRWSSADPAPTAGPADRTVVVALAERLATATHPVLILGGRKRRVTPPTIAAFMDAFRIPTFTTTRQKGLADSRSTYFAGTYLNGTLEQKLLERADLVLLVDAESFDFYNKPWNFTAPAVSLAAGDFLEWPTPLPEQFVADPEATLRALLEDTGDAASQWTVEEVATYRTNLRATLLPEEVTTFSQAHAIDAALDVWPHDGYLVADAGFSKPLLVMLADLTAPDHFFASNALSTMGYSIPAAVAARRAGANPVLAFLGDGSLLMRATELMVSADDGRPAVFVVLVDGALTQIEVKQERRDLATVGSTLPVVSCERLAAAFGIDGIDVDNVDDLRAAVTKGLHGDRPMLVGAHVDPAPSRVLFDALPRMTGDERPVAAVLDKMPELSQQVISEIFGVDFDLVFVDDDSQVEKVRVAASSTVLLTMWGSVDAETIAAAPKARLIQKLGVGTDKIDTAEAERHGIRVLKAAGINAEAVAELAVLLTLAVGRRFPKALAAARSGEVAKEGLRAESFQLLGKRVGLLGFGHIGRAVADRFGGFGVEIVYHDLFRADSAVERACGVTYLEQEELISSADVISLHLPNTPETHKIVDDRFLAKTKPELILINTARGSLIDEAALIRAISEGRMLGAGLDVTAEEPLSVDSPLLGLDQVVLTPHVGGAVANNFPRVIRRAHDNARAVLDGGTLVPADVVV